MMGKSSGTIVLNGITDRELQKIWEIKARNEKSLMFQPNQMQSASTALGEPFYNNIHFQWTGEAGLKLIEEVLAFILKKEEKAEAAH